MTGSDTDTANASTEDTVEVLGGNIFDGPLYKGHAKCIVVRSSSGDPKILHCRLSDRVWGTVTNSDKDFADWLARFGVS